jgi:iron complex outermembrane receptor protein
MLAPNPFTALFPQYARSRRWTTATTSARHEEHQRHLDERRLGHRQLASSDDWIFKYVLARRESDTQTNIDFDTTRRRSSTCAPSRGRAGQPRAGR